MEARLTSKLRLALAVVLFAVTALIASARSVCGFDFNNSDSILAGNVANLCKERTERPTVMDKPLLFGDTDSISNMLQILDCYCRCVGPDSLSHNLIRHMPQQPFNGAMLTFRQPFEKSSHTASSSLPFGFLFERATLLESALAELFDTTAFEHLARTNRRHIDDTTVNPKHFRPGCISDFFSSSQVQIPDLVLLLERGRLRNSPTTIKILAMVIAKDQSDSDATIESREGCKLAFDVEFQSALIVSDSRAFAESMILHLTLVSFGNYSASRANEICRQASLISDGLVSQVMESDRILAFLFKCNIGSGVERGNVSRLRGLDSGEVFASYAQFHFQRDGRFHIGALYILSADNARRAELPPSSEERRSPRYGDL